MIYVYFNEKYLANNLEPIWQWCYEVLNNWKRICIHDGIIIGIVLPDYQSYTLFKLKFPILVEHSFEGMETFTL